MITNISKFLSIQFNEKYDFYKKKSIRCLSLLMDTKLGTGHCFRIIFGYAKSTKLVWPASFYLVWLESSYSDLD